MGLRLEKTNWVFLLASKDEPETRHIYDIKFGIDSLVRAGIAIDDVTVIIDSNKQENIQIIQNIKGFTNKKIHKSSSLNKLFNKNEHDNIVLFVNGHGHYRGLDSNPIITPSSLLTDLQSANNLKHGIVFLGQCFAGIFNYMPVMPREKEGKKLPPLVIVGSTGLDRSISSARILQEKTEYPYQVNIFFYYLFKWIEKPVDIDGDGNYSLIDAYKYIECCVIAFCNYQKVDSLIKRRKDELSLYEAIEKLENKKTPNEEKISTTLIIKSLKKQLSLYEHNQKAWILNAIEAMNVYF